MTEGKKITLAEALELIAKNAVTLSVWADGNIYSSTVESVRHKLFHAHEIFLCSPGSPYDKRSHAIKVRTNNFWFYVETDRRSVNNFWKEQLN